MKRMAVFVTLLIQTAWVGAQPLVPDMDVFAQRRQRFMAQMVPGSVAIFPSWPVALRNLDVEYEYRQESNFWYLSGCEEPESILLLAPSDKRFLTVLFVRSRDDRAEAFEGARSGIEEAMRTYRADTAFFTSDFNREIYRFTGSGRTIYYPFGVNPSMDQSMKRLIVDNRSFAVWPTADPTPILASMRLIKDDGDWKMGLRRAIDISVQAHIEAFKAVTPGVNECEVQAVFEYVFRKNGSPRDGYPCIIGSGPNATILHYDRNTRQIQRGELVLMDCAAEYGYYSADITRTIPVDGKFTTEKRTLYRIVLDAQNAGMARVRAGVAFTAVDSTVGKVLGDGLLRLGFIKDRKDFKAFSPHGYSHWIGLEVHDVGGYGGEGAPVTLEPGMVFTIEPGLYVSPAVFARLSERGYTKEEVDRIRTVVGPYMNIGIRIEDDVLVTRDGHTNLSAGVPRDMDDVEALMREPGMGKPRR